MAIDAQKIRSIFLAAVENHPRSEWNVYLDEACAGDDEVRRRVEALLRGHAAYDSRLDRSPPTTSAVGTIDGLGSVIGHYKLMEQIGEGGMGLVFIAEQQQPVRRKVALKVIKPGMDTRQVVARFEAERQALALMDHPNIARVLDGGETPSGRPFFVMELVKGIPITDYCDRNRLRPRQRLELFIDVCLAVQHAHQRGIIHRDLKPSNVLITSHDGTPVVKVIDFGVAKPIGQQLTDKTVYTQLTQFLGTPLYMSPEQAGQSGLDVDTRTDIYALGVLLYELLTGTTPFDHDRFQTAGCDEIRRIIREEDPPRPSARVSTLLAETATALTANRQSDPKKLSQFLRGELDWVVMKCLEKDRNRRYATANGLAADLRRYLSNENVLACPPSALYQFRKFVQRNRKPVGMATALALMLVLAFVLLLVSNVRIRDEQEQTNKALAAKTQASNELQNALERELYAAYFQRIARADLEWWAYNVGRADQILAECPLESRHWEWQYLNRLCHTDLATFRGHTQAVRAIAISADGQRVASAGDDQTVKIWDVEHAELAPLTFSGHEQPVLSVAFSHNGRQLASAGGDWKLRKPGEVKICDAATGKEILELAGHQAAVGGVAFSPDDKIVATAGWDWTLRLWDSTTGQELRRLPHTASLKCVAFSPDGSRIACAGVDKIVTVWNVADGRKLRTLHGHSSSILGVAFSADGQRLVSGSWDHTARIWDLANGRTLVVLRGNQVIVHGVAFCADDTKVATACGDGSLKVWDSQTGQERRTLRGHSGPVFAAAFTPGGRGLVSAGSDQTVKLWDLAADPEYRYFPLPESNRPRLACSPDGKQIASANLRLATRKASVRVRVFDSHTGREILALPEHPEGCNFVAYRPDGKQLATDWGNDVKTWDARTGRDVVTFKGHSGPVLSVAYSPDGDLLASASVDKTVKIWDAATGKQVGALALALALALAQAGHGAAVTSVAFHPIPGSPYLVSGSKDRSVRIWDVKGQRVVADLLGHRGPITEVVFSRDGQFIASASEDGDVRIWEAVKTQSTNAKQEAPSGRLLHVLSGHGGGVNAVTFSPDGKRVVSAHEDGTVTIWDTRTGQEALSLRRQVGPANSVAFSPSGRRLLVGGPPIGAYSSGVTIWEAEPAKSESAAIQQLLAQDVRDAWYFKARAASVSNPAQAIALYSKALELGRDDAAVLSERGTQNALLGNWANAAADYAEASRRCPRDVQLCYRQAAAHLGENDMIAYKKTRASILERFGKTTDPAVASPALYICVALPGAETEPLVRLGKAAAPLFAGNERVLAAALYRTGSYQAALEQFDRSAKAFPPRAWDLLFRAMAHHRLERSGEARDCFREALAWIEHANQQTAAGNRNAWIGWYESIETNYLREEAAALLGENCN